MSFAELLAPYRALEGDRTSPPGQRHAHVATMIVRDEDLQAVVVAWSTLPVKWRQPRCRMPEGIHQRWAWFWKGVRYDETDLAAVAGIGLAVLGAKVAQARALRLIYPDGTINVWAKAIVEQQALQGRNRGQRQRQRQRSQ